MAAGDATRSTLANKKRRDSRSKPVEGQALSGEVVAPPAPAAPPSIVPFGKYRGQPVEVLAQDRPYLDWLTAQDWFRTRYENIYTLVVNNFTEATETPEHNALQVLFLDFKFCVKFFKVLNPEATTPKSFYRNFEVKNGFDVWLQYEDRYSGPEVFVEIKPTVGDDYPAVLRQIRHNSTESIPPQLRRSLESTVSFLGSKGKTAVLFTERYTGRGATQKQFIETFADANIRVVFRHEVRA